MSDLPEYLDECELCHDWFPLSKMRFNGIQNLCARCRDEDVSEDNRLNLYIAMNAGGLCVAKVIAASPDEAAGIANKMAGLYLRAEDMKYVCKEGKHCNYIALPPTT